MICLSSTFGAPFCFLKKGGNALETYREIYIRSTLNGDVGISFLKKFLDNSLDPPPIGSIVPPACIVQNFGRLKQGIIKDVKISKKSIQVWVGTQTSIHDLREILIPEGWEEVCAG